MAPEVKDHIHLDDVTPPTDTYGVFREGFQVQPYAFAATDYALEATVHVHRVAPGGVVELRDDFSHVLIVSYTEYLTLRGMIGKTVYFVDSYHDDGSLATYTDTKLFKAISKVTPFTPDLSGMYVQIALEDLG